MKTIVVTDALSRVVRMIKEAISTLEKKNPIPGSMLYKILNDFREDLSSLERFLKEPSIYEKLEGIFSELDKVRRSITDIKISREKQEEMIRERDIPIQGSPLD